MWWPVTIGYCAKRTQIPGYACRGHLQSEILDACHYHVSPSPKSGAQREHILMKEWEFSGSGYLGFNYILSEK